MVGNFSKTIYRFYLFNQKGDGGGGKNLNEHEIVFFFILSTTLL